MRFLDWDVLLMPQSTGIPLHEFRTEGFQSVNGLGITDTVNSFVPSLPRGALFNISICSWTQPALSPVSMAASQAAVVAVKVEIDGVVVAVETVPRIARQAHVVNPLGRGLIFPPFHKDLVRQAQLNIQDNRGRISVELCEGFYYRQAAQLRFRPTKNIVCFKWVHAPLGILQKHGIAWPIPHQMMADPAPPTFNYGQMDPAAMYFPLGGHNMCHSGFYTTESSAASDAGFLSDIPNTATSSQAFGPLLDNIKHLDYGYTGGSIDLTSADAFGGPLAGSIHAPCNINTSSELQVRLPDDQIQEIVDALGPPLAGSGTPMDIPSLTSPADGFSRNISDTSMHDACDQYPECVVDAPNGKGVTHNPRQLLATPKQSPRGRKRISKDYMHSAPAKRVTRRKTAVSLPQFEEYCAS